MQILEANINTTQKIYLIPGAVSFGTTVPSEATQQNINQILDNYIQLAETNPKIIGMFPYIWQTFPGYSIGTQHMPLVRAKLIEYGRNFTDPCFDVICPVDSWINSGDGYACCDATQTAMCQNQSLLHHVCSYGVCQNSIVNSRTVKSDQTICNMKPDVCLGSTQRHYTDAQCSNLGCTDTYADIFCPYGCFNGTCNNNPCISTQCITPQTAYCNDNSLVSYVTPGTCTPSSASYVCSYQTTSQICDFGCSNGSCLSNPCSGTICNTPPLDYCSSGSLISYVSTGVCSSGTCSYSTFMTNCTFGCSNGDCYEDPCIGKTCDIPPENYCSGEMLMTYKTPGMCNNGYCIFSQSQIMCEFGCSLGICNGDPSLTNTTINQNLTSNVIDLLVTSRTLDSVTVINKTRLRDSEYKFREFYVVEGVKNVKFLAIWTISMNVIAYIDPETMTIMNTITPFWSFLAW
jgi:hypothetical protein